MNGIDSEGPDFFQGIRLVESVHFHTSMFLLRQAQI